MRRDTRWAANAPHRFGLGAALLDTLFPFHVAVDRRLSVVQLGRSLARACPELTLGASLTDHLTLVSPRAPFAFDGLAQRPDALVVLKTASGMTLRGQAAPVAPGILCFLGSPWVTDPYELSRLGLTLSDFALQDSVVDYLFLLQAQSTALADAQRLAARLQQLDEETTRLAASEQTLARELDAIPDLVLRLGCDGRLLHVRPSRHGGLADRPEQLVGRQAEVAFPEMGRLLADAMQRAFRLDSAQAFEYEVERDGRETCYEARVVRCSDAEALALVRDVTERRLLERQLARQAFQDRVTGLANRALFEERVEHALVRLGAEGRSLCVLSVVLDDTLGRPFGHPVGDELLAAAAERLRRCLQPGDTAARLGGDEFAVLVERRGTQADAVADRLLGAFAEPFALHGAQLRLAASIGLAESGPTSTCADLLRTAGRARCGAQGPAPSPRARSASGEATSFPALLADGPQPVLPSTADAHAPAPPPASPSHPHRSIPA